MGGGFAASRGLFGRKKYGIPGLEGLDLPYPGREDTRLDSEPLESLPGQPREADLPEPALTPNPPRPVRPATRLEGMEEQYQGQPPSKKSVLLQAIMAAAPIAAGAIFGGSEGATGAAQGVMDFQGRERELKERRRGELGRQIEAERSRQARTEESKIRSQTAANALAEQVRQFNQTQGFKEKTTGTTVGEGQTRLDSSGKPIFTAPARKAVLPAGGTLVDTSTGKPIATGQPKVPTKKSLQSKDVTVRGRKAVVNYDPETGKYFDQGAKEIPPGDVGIYEKPSVALLNRDEMMPIIDRVARNLAGVDMAGKSIPPDMTSIRQISSMRGDQRLMLYDKIKQYNPKYNTASIDRKIKLMDFFQVGKGRENLQSLDTFIQHAAEVIDVAQSVENTDSRLMNKTLNWWRENMANSPELKRLETALEPAQKEFESYLLGGRALYTDDRKLMQVIVSPTSTLKEVKGAMNQMGKTVKDRYVAQNHSYKREMGEDLKDAFSEEGQIAAQKIGIDLTSSGKSLKTDMNARPSRIKILKVE